MATTTMPAVSQRCAAHSRIAAMSAPEGAAAARRDRLHRGAGLDMGRRALPLPASAAAFSRTSATKPSCVLRIESRARRGAADRRHRRGDRARPGARDARGDLRADVVLVRAPRQRRLVRSGFRRRHRRRAWRWCRPATATASAIRKPEVVERWQSAGAQVLDTAADGGALRVPASGRRGMASGSATAAHSRGSGMPPGAGACAECARLALCYRPD